MRKKNSLKNFFTDIIPYALFAILGFFEVKIFINSLGEEIYALNQLFIQLFSYISLVEGGVGAIIGQKYYKLFANLDKDKIRETYASSKIMMKKISVLIFIIGVLVSFFLQFLTNNSLKLGYMQIVFYIYIFKCILEYLNISPRFVIQADQKAYKINIIVNFFKLLEVSFEIILLLYGIDYMLILIFAIIIKIIMYYFINKKIYKEYPWLIEKKYNNTEKITGIGYMYYHKIAGAIYNNIDILLISAKCSTFYVTIYASYNYICKYLNDMIYMFGNSFMASLGNVIYKEDNAKSYKIFEELNSFFLFVASFFSINVFCLSNNFVSLWIGKEYSNDKTIIIFMSLLLFFNVSKRILSLVCETKGLYKETKNIVIFEALINLILSLVFINIWGVNGVLLATIISYLLTTFWCYPKFVYKNIFDKKYTLYYKNYFIALLLSITICILSKIFITINVSNIFDWILFGLLNSTITGIILFVIFYIFINSFRRIIKKLIGMRRNEE